MRHGTKGGFVALLLAGALGCGGASAQGGSQGSGETFAIRIHRPLQAGQRFRVDVDTHHVLTFSGDGADASAPPLDEHVALQGVVTVQSADPEGRALEATLAVDRFVNPDTGAALLEPGAVISVRREGSDVTVALVNGQITREQVNALVLAFPFERPGSPLGDELLGTDAPRAVGDRWTVGRSSVAEDLQDDGFEVAETTVGGEVTLARVEPCDGARCLVLEANLVADQVTMLEYADEASFETGRLEALVRVLAPEDPADFLRGEEAELTGRFVADFRVDGGTVTRQVDVRRRRVARYTAVR